MMMKKKRVNRMSFEYFEVFFISWMKEMNEKKKIARKLDGFLLFLNLTS
jgi:hypothetical protein